MEKFLEQLLGQHGWEIWIAGLIWSLLGIALIKIYFYDKTVRFSLKFWLNDNFRDVLLGIVANLILLRLGDYGIQLLTERFGYDIGTTSDFVGLMIVVSAFIQYKLHKNREKLKKSK